MIRILIVNETQLISSVIASILEDEPDFQVIGSTMSVDEAVLLAKKCDIALVSTRLPENDALKLTKNLAEDCPYVKILVLGLAESESEILGFIEAGAAGYVLKDDSVDALLRNIRAAYNNEALISPEIAAALVVRVSELANLFSTGVGFTESIELTPREREVLALISKDFSNQEIAQRLVIEVGTVKNHVHNILEKLNVSSRQDAAAYWLIISSYEDSSTS
jgi:DNA-binding NarL/FixJ family response regulator